MNALQSFLNRFFTPVKPLPAGIYPYQTPPEALQQYRLHLRLEEDGSGILIVNASIVLHLNHTAAEYAYYLVKDMPEQVIASQMARRYNVPQDKTLQDYQDFKERLDILIHTPDLDPVGFLGFDRKEPLSAAVVAPYRLDCALTYQVSNGESDSAAPLERVRRELVEQEWQQIINKAWAAGIPHVVFTGGEPTLRPDLAALLTHAEGLGMVTGLLTDGLRLTNPDYLHELLDCGLDHIMLVFQPEEEQSWEALRDLMPEDIHTTIHLTLTEKNQEEVTSILQRMAGMGVKSLSLSAASIHLKPVLDQAAITAAELQISLVWDLPVPYSSLNPVALDQEAAGEIPDVDGLSALYVEPDGDVLRGQGQPEVLGNLLRDEWSAIWQHARA
ncbi:MAG: radical SAM protein [Chloroflexi bacterium]|nr:radical SAM protein [Chloroflexota bacterium]